MRDGALAGRALSRGERRRLQDSQRAPPRCHAVERNRDIVCQCLYPCVCDASECRPDALAAGTATMPIGLQRKPSASVAHTDISAPPAAQMRIEVYTQHFAPFLGLIPVLLLHTPTMASSTASRTKQKLHRLANTSTRASSDMLPDKVPLSIPLVESHRQDNHGMVVFDISTQVKTQAGEHVGGRARHPGREGGSAEGLRGARTSD